jgi:hypothetical protein
MSIGIRMEGIEGDYIRRIFVSICSFFMKTTEYDVVNDSIRSYTVDYGRRNARPGTIFINDLNSEQQLEHNMTTAIRIDHFLTQYCSV